MKITILGTGTSTGIPMIGCQCKVCKSPDPFDKRLRVSIFLDTGTHKILIDTGPDLRQQMLTHNIQQVDYVLITHEHNDHIIGLDDLRAYNFLTGKSLPLYASPDVIEVIKDKFSYVFKENPYPGAPKIDALPILHDFIELEDERIEVISYMHGELPVIGFKFKNFAYLTDLKTISEEQKARIQGLDTLILSCIREKPHFSHLNLEEALALIEELKPKVCYLTHLSHVFGTHKEISQRLPEHVFLAHDGLTLAL